MWNNRSETSFLGCQLNGRRLARPPTHTENPRGSRDELRTSQITHLLFASFTFPPPASHFHGTKIKAPLEVGR